MTEFQVKAAVRERDGYRCTRCGMTQERHLVRLGQILHVHRIVPGSEYTVEGCVTVCIVCHGPLARRGNGERIRSRLAAGKPVPLGIEVSTHLARALERCCAAKKWTKRSAVEEALRVWLTAEGFPPPPAKD
jgi:hypothetical protein